MRGRRATLGLGALALVVAGGGVVAHRAGIDVPAAKAVARVFTASSPEPEPAPPEQPVERDAARTAAPQPKPVNHCAHNKRAQLVLVSITDQHAWLCAHRRTVYSTAVTTGRAGRDTATPAGHYRIQGLNRDAVLLPNDGQRYHVRYWIPFDAPDYGFHDASWQHFPYGSGKYKIAGSHGCVHLPLKAIKFLYRWADIGAAVTIHA
jgi:lipoprotein-anchoring transpeptidase ErfK/SrfK